MTRSFPIVVTLMVPNAEYVLLKVPSFGRSAAIDAARVSTDLRCDGAEYPLAQPPTGHVLRAIPRAPQQPLPGRLGTMPALERQSIAGKVDRNHAHQSGSLVVATNA
jgi:hypothetical protein